MPTTNELMCEPEKKLSPMAEVEGMLSEIEIRLNTLRSHSYDTLQIVHNGQTLPTDSKEEETPVASDRFERMKDKIHRMDEKISKTTLNLNGIQEAMRN